MTPDRSESWKRALDVYLQAPGEHVDLKEARHAFHLIESNLEEPLRELDESLAREIPTAVEIPLAE